MRKVICIILICLIACVALGGSIDYDGVDDNCAPASSSVFDYSDSESFSISIWAKTSGDAERQTIFDKRVLGAGGKGYALWVETDGTAEFFTSDGSAARFVRPSTVLDDGEWHHYASVYDHSANTIDLYIDGVSPSGSTSLTTQGNISNNGKFYIGDGNINTPGSSLKEWNGKIGNLAVWNSALSSDEISRIYNSGMLYMPLQVDPSNIDGVILFDDESDGTSADGDAFTDYSGNGNSMTGNDGANNTGLTAKAEEVLSYPWSSWSVIAPVEAGGSLDPTRQTFAHGICFGIGGGVR